MKRFGETSWETTAEVWNEIESRRGSDTDFMMLCIVMGKVFGMI